MSCSHPPVPVYSIVLGLHRPYVHDAGARPAAAQRIYRS